MYRIGIDVGGTFTDVVLVDEHTGAGVVAKVLNEPGRKAETVVRGIQKVLDDAKVSPDQVSLIGHGTTIATNAVLERKGARSALVTNKGFRDVLEIGRFSRPPELIYRVQEDKPPPLVPRYLRMELDCRIDSEGRELRAVDPAELDTIVERLKSETVEAVAVSLLFSFLNPVHERMIGERLRKALPGVYILLSSDIQPEFREFPRTSTTVFAAAVAPIIGVYLDRLQSGLAAAGIGSPLYIFQSNGGVAQPQLVMRRPSTLFLSGPAGAVVGAAQLAIESGYKDLITIDMGGTSLDVCVLRNGVAETTASREIDHFPIVSPMLDVHTIGAGGGSLCRIDEVGRLRVGPQSASSDPGPACYGRGGTGLTLTDVNLVLGYLDPSDFAGGSVRLYPEKAKNALQDAVAGPLKIDPIEAAAGVWRVAANQMAEAIRYVTVQRGVDPRGFDLVAFGGGGPIHAYGVAEDLGLRRFIVPIDPGLFSARGIALADFTHDYLSSLVQPIERVDVRQLASSLADLKERANADLASEQVKPEARDLVPSLDLRYLGQSTEINVRLPDGQAATTIDLAAFVAEFHRRHEELYTYSVPNEPVELVNLRLRAIGRVSKPPRGVMSCKTSGKPAGSRRAWFPRRGMIETPVWRREDLSRGARLEGPMIIQEMSSATIIPPGAVLEVDAIGNLLITLPQFIETFMAIDPFTLAVIQNALISVASEMKLMTMRTAYTQLWKEQGDLSCCVMDAAGQIVAQDPSGFPIHVTTMPFQLQSLVEGVGRDTIEPGDVLMTNDPFLGGTHLPDVLIARPLFWEHKLYGYLCNRGHWADIGGMGPGSYSPATKELLQEGLVIPPVKLFVKDQIQKPLVDLVVRNVRNSVVAHGDMRAQYASCFAGERRFREIITRYGLATVTEAMAEILTRSESMTRARIAEFRDGEYHARDCLDGDGLRDEPQWIDAKVTVKGSAITVDLTGSSDQSTGGMNCSRASAISGVQYAIKAITDPENPPNAGSYRPITVLTRPGSFCDALSPRSIVGYGEVAYRVLDTVMRALSDAAPQQVLASGSGSTGTVAIGGQDNRPNAKRGYFVTLELSSGAYGARATKDGLNAIRYGAGNAGHVPVEASEMENPIRYERIEVMPDTGGAGTYRGGNGFCRVFTVLVDSTEICICADRHKSHPQGLFGGMEGTTARYLLDPGTPKERVLSSKTPYIPLAKGTVVWVQSAGGGGYGDPKKRAPESIRRDLRDGYITTEFAKAHYGT